jgi:hypothetical protein
MKMNFDIVEIEDYSGKMAHIYSLVMENEEESLLEQFFAENAEYKQEINEIDELLYGMGHILGCQRNLFKHNEGALGDGVAAVRVGQLRLYCLYFDNTAVFLGREDTNRLKFMHIRKIKNLMQRHNKCAKLHGS